MLFNTGIYRIRNTVSGKSYYGSSKNIKGRFTRHRSKLRLGKHINRYLQNAWNKHGEDSFVFELVEECAVEHLFDIEQPYLDSNSNGYNIALIAGGGDTITNHPDRENILKKMEKTRVVPIFTKETRELMSGKNSAHFIGYYHTPFGVFESTYLAAKKNDFITSDNVHDWCKNSTNVIRGWHIKSKYVEHLINNGFDIIGKTFKDIGFWFEPIDGYIDETPKLSQTIMNYITPKGTFMTCREASNVHNITRRHVNDIFKNCDKKIKQKTKLFSKDDVGKTPREMGFYRITR